MEPSFEVLGIPVFTEDDECIDINMIQNEMGDVIKESVYRTLQCGCPIEAIYIDRDGLVHHKMLPLYAAL